MNLRFASACVAVFSVCSGLASGTTRQVGPTRTYTTVLAAYAAASSGDTIEIDSGTYYQGQGWVYVNGKNNLTFRGVGATRPVIDAGNSCYKQKGIFVIEIGTSGTVIENLELKNARGNPAAGVRMQGNGLTLRNVYIHDCDNGVLNGGGTMLFEYSEFNHNGDGTGQTHNMYLNGTGSFTMRYCWSHNAVTGHQVKTRMPSNYILYNLIADDGGSGSYEVDIPDAGTSYVIGNVIYQSGYGNSGMIDYAEESSNNADRHLYVANNTVISTVGGTFVYNASSTTAVVMNNIFQGSAVLSGLMTQTTNLPTTNAYFFAPTNYDFHLTSRSTGAIDKGTTPGTNGTPATGIDGFSLLPVSQYIHPYSYEARPANGQIDIGAYEYVAPNQPPTVNAGTDLKVIEGQTVSLHATASDPDNDTLTYTWTQPAGLNVTLIGGSTADLSFTTPAVNTVTQAAMTFNVTVNDGKGGTASDSVAVRVYMLGDVNQDDSVDVVDLLTFVPAFGSVLGDSVYDATCDFNNDNSVDVVDLLILVSNFGRTLAP